jgi:hypothetical protein
MSLRVAHARRFVRDACVVVGVGVHRAKKEQEEKASHPHGSHTASVRSPNDFFINLSRIQ